MGRCVITRGRQALELRSNLSERRSLTDPIQNSDQFSSSYSLRNLQWAISHGSFSYFYNYYCIIIMLFLNVIKTLELRLQFSQRALCCSLTVALGFSSDLPQSFPTLWSFTLGYWRSQTILTPAMLNSQTFLWFVIIHFVIM